MDQGGLEGTLPPKYLFWKIPEDQTSLSAPEVVKRLTIMDAIYWSAQACKAFIYCFLLWQVLVKLLLRILVMDQQAQQICELARRSEKLAWRKHEQSRLSVDIWWWNSSPREWRRRWIQKATVSHAKAHKALGVALKLMVLTVKLCGGFHPKCDITPSVATPLPVAHT